MREVRLLCKRIRIRWVRRCGVGVVDAVRFKWVRV